MSKEQVKASCVSNSNLMDEEEDLSEYIDSLDWNKRQTRRNYAKALEIFKDDKYNAELAKIANDHGLQPQT